MKNKKFIYFFLALFILIILVNSSVLALNVNLLTSTSEYSATQVIMWAGNQVQIIGVNLPSDESYVLIYAEDKNIPSSNVCDRRTPGCQIRPGPSTYSSSRYPKIKCFMDGITINSQGMVSKISKFNYLGITSNKKAEKLYLVPSSDVKCKTNRMIHWNPENYLVGKQTI